MLEAKVVQTTGNDSPEDRGIQGSGEMATLMRQLGWQQTRLGPPESWPDALRMSVNLILGAPLPMQLLWGPELVSLYNDAMRPTLSDKHPASLGQDGSVVWSEVWDLVAPQLEEVLRTGKPISVLGVPLKLLQDGVLRQMYWDYSYSPVFDENGDVVGVLNISRNVTDLHQTQMALVQSEKLAAVGKLAASIAHEINNPLESVTNLMYLAAGSDNLDQAREYIEVAERELRRVSVISSQTLRFHRQSTRPAEVTCLDLFQSVMSVYQGRLVNARIEVLRRKRARRGVQCFDGEIRQVLGNLVGNAIDAMHPQGGNLVLRSQDGTDWRTGRPGIVLTVADTGIGMSEALREKVFEAFYTTKGFGGTGLGLWVSKEIVDRHGGVLSLRSSTRPEAHGTVFRLFLPLEALPRQASFAAE